MWWPRPRWKSDIFTRFVLLLLFIITTTASTKNTVMADEGQQHCGASNMSAVVWTTVLCTMLLILAIVAIYFVYCKRREYEWSSLWWKSNSDKNLVLQTSAPVKNQQLKNGGTDNPAFSADAYNGDCVTRTGLTRVVRVSSSFLSEGSLENELSLKEEDGRKIYVCKHSDGTKDQLVALRLVFDKGEPQQLSRPPASDLSRSLVELSRKYGLHVELETEGEAAAGTREKCEDNAAKCAKPNILSAVCGQAQRLWHQRQMVFKGADGGSRGVDAEKEIADGDVESGRVRAEKAAPVQRSPCTVTTVNETADAERPARQHGGSLRYRTLEYGASPADAEAQSSPDSGVQCCTVNPSECVRTQADEGVTAASAAAKDSDEEEEKESKDAEPAKDAVTAVDRDEAAKAEKDETAMAVPDRNATAPLKTADGGRPAKNDEPKHANPPPPPPPRKYSAPVAPPTVPATAAIARTANEANAGNVTAAPEPSAATPVPVARAEPAKPSTAAAVGEIRVDDDYYWCTTTAMAPPPMSTFGKRPSATPSVDSGSGSGASETATIGDGAAPVAGACGKSLTVAALAADDGRDVVAGGTTSIEDASLPSFSSDEEEDDEDGCSNSGAVSAAADKSKFPPPSNTVDTPVNGVVGAAIVVGKNGGGGDDGVSPNNNNNNNNSSSFNKNKNNCDDDGVDGSTVVPAVAAEPKSPTKLPTLRLSLSSPLSSTAATSCCSSSASSISSTSPSPTNSAVNSSPIVSKIPVRRQSGGGGAAAVPAPLANGSAKKSIPLPLSRSGSRLAMWSSAN